MDKFNQFYTAYHKIENEQKKMEFLKEFMLSLSGEELSEFVVGNVRTLREDAQKHSYTEAERKEYGQIMDKAIASLQELKKKAAA